MLDHITSLLWPPLVWYISKSNLLQAWISSPNIGKIRNPCMMGVTICVRQVGMNTWYSEQSRVRHNLFFLCCTFAMTVKLKQQLQCNLVRYCNLQCRHKFFVCNWDALIMLACSRLQVHRRFYSISNLKRNIKPMQSDCQVPVWCCVMFSQSTPQMHNQEPFIQFTRFLQPHPRISYKLLWRWYKAHHSKSKYRYSSSTWIQRVTCSSGASTTQALSLGCWLCFHNCFWGVFGALLHAWHYRCCYKTCSKTALSLRINHDHACQWCKAGPSCIYTAKTYMSSWKNDKMSQKALVLRIDSIFICSVLCRVCLGLAYMQAETRFLALAANVETMKHVEGCISADNGIYVFQIILTKTDP